MRVVFINSIFPNPVEPNKGNFILKNLLKYPSDIQVEVVAPVPFGLGWRRNRAEKVPLKRQIQTGETQLSIHHPRFVLLPRNILRRWIPILEAILIFPCVFRIHQKRKIELLHANFASPDGIACRYLAKALNIPYIITEHQAALDNYLQIPWLISQMALAYRDAQRVISVSQNTKDIMLSHLPYLKNITVIPNGIDIQNFPLKAKAEKPRKMLYIGYLVQHKGIHILLKALKLLTDSGCDLQLSIVGEGTYRTDLEQLCSSLGLNSRVDFQGEKTAEEVAEILTQHDFLVHPSFIESFGIVVVEAMACGLPVVATINGGSESIVSPDTGILVKANDEQALADGILQLISSWESYNPRSIRAYASSHFSREYVVGETIKQYYTPVRKTICHLSSVHIRSDVRVFYKQCTSLYKAGFKVHLVVADGKGKERKDGILIHDVGPFPSRKQRFILAPLYVLLKALALKADAYQIHDPELIPIAILLKMISHKPIVYDIHECYPEMFLHKEYLSPQVGRLISLSMRYLERIALRVLDQGIAATEHIAEQFTQVPIIHNYPIISEWTSITDNPLRYSSRNICYLGSITKERGLSQVLKAIESVDCILHLAGSYEPASYRDELKSLPGWSKVIEYGYVNRQQAAVIFSQCAVGIVLFDHSPNHLYSLSTKMFEYMAAGLPIVVSDLPANVKLLDRANVGIYVDPMRISEIAKCLSDLLSHPERLQEMGEKGKKIINTELSWEAEELAFTNIYRRILKMEIT